MPLPNLKNPEQFCQAKKRSTGEPCKNPAAYGCQTCRYHGARKQTTVLKGVKHPNYKHGQRSIEGLRAYQEASKSLLAVEELGFKIGLLTGQRIKGRRPL
jgi:phage protein U